MTALHAMYSGEIENDRVAGRAFCRVPVGAGLSFRIFVNRGTLPSGVNVGVFNPSHEPVTSALGSNSKCREMGT